MAGGLAAAGILLPSAARAQDEAEAPEPAGDASEPRPLVGRPLIVQIDNEPRARPPSNLGAARYVYEYITEGNVTRFSAIYIDQDDVGPIGNVRSGRLATIEIVQQFDGILFYHGGSTGVQDRIWQSLIDFVSFELVENYPFFTRVPWRPRPWNSYTDLPRLRAAAAANDKALSLPGRNEFVHGPYELGPGDGRPVNRIQIPYQPGFQVRYEHDPSTNTYWRWMGGQPHYDEGLPGQITTQNVIVQFAGSYVTDIVEDVFGSRSLDFDLQGTGVAWLFRDGIMVEAMWHRAAAWDFTAYYDVFGRRIPLAPGTAWISIVAPGTPVRAWHDADA